MEKGRYEKDFNILLVDDDSVDRELFKDAINLSRKNVHITEASDGQAALQVLETSGMLPDVIFLDLNMPVKDGRETLRQIRNNDVFSSIPVCILSTSNAHFEVSSAYKSGANLFLVKPLNFKDLIEMLSSLLTLFSKFVVLPERAQ